MKLCLSAGFVPIGLGKSWSALGSASGYGRGVRSEEFLWQFTFITNKGNFARSVLFQSSYLHNNLWNRHIYMDIQTWWSKTAVMIERLLNNSFFLVVYKCCYLSGSRVLLAGWCDTTTYICRNCLTKYRSHIDGYEWRRVQVRAHSKSLIIYFNKPLIC